MIQAVGGAVAAVLGIVLAAWQANTATKVRDLEARLAVVESERDEFRLKFRASVRHIRDWMGWAMHHAPLQPPPPVPLELRDEV